MTPIQVFLSSTFREFHEARDAIYKSKPKLFEIWEPESAGTSSLSNNERVNDAIDDALVFIGIVGEQPGSDHPDFDGETIVQAEFQRARERFKKEKSPELLVYLPEHLVSAGPPATMDARQKKFVESLTHYTKGLGYDFFKSTQELATKVQKRLEKLKLDWAEAYTQKREQNAEAMRMFYVAIASVAGTLSILAGGAGTYLAVVGSLHFALLLLLVSASGIGAAYFLVRHAFS